MVIADPGVTARVATALPPSPPATPLVPAAPWAPDTENVAEVTPAGTVQVCAAPVKQKVTVSLPPLKVGPAHGAAATGMRFTEAKTTTANARLIAADRKRRISFLQGGSDSIVRSCAPHVGTR
jgi:hypothetical protein